MKTLILTLLIGLVAVSEVLAHGTPIDVSVVDNRLVASHSTVTSPFPLQIFGDADEEGDFFTVAPLPGLGSTILWQVPGLNITGMSSTSSLSIEVLARPVVDSSSSEHRALWYWNPITEAVEPSPADFHLLGKDMRSLTLHADDSLAPAPFLLADPVAGETGFHNHGLLSYGLDDDNTAPAGVYGFFARLSSNQYASSDPFLVVFNYATDYDSIVPASLEIYHSATIDGDFDLDNDVDGRDFLAWQRLNGSTTRTIADASLDGIVDAADLAIWQQNFGEVFGSASALATVQVPEPTSVGFYLTAIAFAAFCRKRPQSTD